MHVPPEHQDDKADKAVQVDGDTTHLSLSLIGAIASEEKVLQPSEQIVQEPQQAALLAKLIIEHSPWGETVET